MAIYGVKDDIELKTFTGHSDSVSSLAWSPDCKTIASATVALAPTHEIFRDSRGLARALTGNIKGAIEDFQAFIKSTEDAKQKAQRQRWINALRAGKNPFT